MEPAVHPGLPPQGAILVPFKLVADEGHWTGGGDEESATVPVRNETGAIAWVDATWIQTSRGVEDMGDLGDLPLPALALLHGQTGMMETESAFSTPFGTPVRSPLWSPRTTSTRGTLPLPIQDAYDTLTNKVTTTDTEARPVERREMTMWRDSSRDASRDGNI